VASPNHRHGFAAADTDGKSGNDPRQLFPLNPDQMRTFLDNQALFQQIALQSTAWMNQPKGKNKSPFSLDGPVTDRSKMTLVVENIPEDKCVEEDIRGFFSQFGTIVSLSMRPHKRLAIVKFDTWNAANQAYMSPKAVFDNRFVKVYWYNENETAPEPLNGQVANGHQVPPDVGQSSATPVPRMNQFLRRQEAAQKAHENKQEKLKKVAEDRAKAHERLQELLKMHKETTVKILRSSQAENDSQSNELRLQLAKLESEAIILGLDPDDASSMAGEDFHVMAPPHGRQRGMWGGRRSRGYAPGLRGLDGPGSRHALYAKYSLDLRPKTVRIRGTDFSSSKNGQLIRDYFSVSSAGGRWRATDDSETTNKS
jgi:RNA-binding protein 26